MTIRFTLTLAVEGAATERVAGTHVISTVIERASLTAEALGLTLAEGKAILAELQAAIVAEQVTAHEAAARTCQACETGRSIKDHRPLTCRTTFGTLPLTAIRLRRCRCGADHAAGNRASFSPLADLLPGRTTPELLYLETRWGALVSYGLAARMLGDVLPMDRPVSPERVRRHLHGVVADEGAGGRGSSRLRSPHKLPTVCDGLGDVGRRRRPTRHRRDAWRSHSGASRMTASISPRAGKTLDPSLLLDQAGTRDAK